MDAALLAILNGCNGTVTSPKEARARVILAVLCLADEPNVRQETADNLLQQMVRHVEKGDVQVSPSTGLSLAASGLAASTWSESFQAALVREYQQRGPGDREYPGLLFGRISTATLPAEPEARVMWLKEQLPKLTSTDEACAIATALQVGYLSKKPKLWWIDLAGENPESEKEENKLDPEPVDGLIFLLSGSPAAANAAGWALYWVRRNGMELRHWQPSKVEIVAMLKTLERSDTDPGALMWLARFMGEIELAEAFVPLRALIRHVHAPVRIAAPGTLLTIRNDVVDAALFYDRLADLKTISLEQRSGAVASESDLLKQARRSMRARASGRIFRSADGYEMGKLTYFGDEPLMLIRDLRCVDPVTPIDENQVRKAANTLKLDVNEVRRRYEALARDYGLELTWQRSDRADQRLEGQNEGGGKEVKEATE